jgi:hypothetical protein
MQCSEELLRLAAKAGRLADQVSRESDVYRMAGRLNRLVQFQFSDLSEREITAFAEAHINQVTEAEDFFADDPHGFFRVHCAIAQVSYRMWEDLWNERHPDSFGKAWDGEDFDLMALWRAKVRTTIKDCRQDAVLAMSAEEYAAKLIAVGAGEQAAKDLADWLSEVAYELEETTGSC